MKLLALNGRDPIWIPDAWDRWQYNGFDFKRRTYRGRTTVKSRPVGSVRHWGEVDVVDVANVLGELDEAKSNAKPFMSFVPLAGEARA